MCCSVLFCHPTPPQNLKRVAETWMDEFTEYIYQRRPEYRHLSTGDLSTQKALRKRLKCKDFRWYMETVAWDIPKYYPPVEPPPAAWGEVSLLPALGTHREVGLPVKVWSGRDIGTQRLRKDSGLLKARCVTSGA